MSVKTAQEQSTVAVQRDLPSPEWDAGRSAGRLVVAWQHPGRRLIAPVGLLDHHADGYEFRYLRRALETDGFQPFVSFPDWERRYTSEVLFALFAQRIMSPRRPDFTTYLRQLDLDERATPWEQLARSEGRRAGDTVQVFPVPQVRDDGATTCRFLVHGIRHVVGDEVPRLAPGDVLALQPQPDNQFNPEAQLVCTSDGRAFGYVPDLMLEHLAAVQAGGPVTLAVEHVNGPEVPSHLRVLARLEGRVPTGYQPMSGPRWETFV